MAFCENSVPWLYVLDRHFTWKSGLEINEDVAFKDKTGVIRLVLEKGGRVTVMRGYAWNGCSPKYCLFDILLGPPEGVVDSRTGRPKTFHASLVHDALYQFVPDGLPLTRRQADRCFLWLLEETGFRPRILYYLAVRALGWLVRRGTRYVRKTVGTKVLLEPEIAQ